MAPARQPASRGTIQPVDSKKQSTRGDPAVAFATLSEFLAENDLTERLGQVEKALVDTDAKEVAAIVRTHGLTADLLDAALAVRSRVGRLNDVIHAATISAVLPLILEVGERMVKPPSLGAGNDRSRPFDLETDRRVAEFKVSQWKGADTMRKLAVVADLVHLALDGSGRKPELYIVGEKPMHFLTNSSATMLWALGRSSPHTRERFTNRFSSNETMSIAEFKKGPAAHVELVDLRRLVPGLE